MIKRKFKKTERRGLKGRLINIINIKKQKKRGKKEMVT